MPIWVSRMCGRFVITSPPAALRQIFGYVEQPNFPPRYNIAPTQPIPVVILENGARHFRLMRWGLLPAWVKDPRKFTLLINARAETVQEKPAFKNAIRRRRCLIPADGYYEWQDAERPQAAVLHPSPRRRADRLCRAGGNLDRAERRGDSTRVAIVTAPASPDLAVLHHRVPVTIAPDDFERWLDCRGDDADDVMALLRGPAKASSPGTRFRPGSTTSPMTTRNCCCRSPTSSARPRSRSPRRRPRRARRRRRRRMTGRGRCSEGLRSS